MILKNTVLAKEKVITLPRGFLKNTVCVQVAATGVKRDGDQAAAQRPECVIECIRLVY
jgi:hypothetical protein